MTEVDNYLTHLRVRGLRPNTIAQAERILRWVQDALGREPGTATSTELECFLGRRDHAATRAVEWSYLSGFYRWAVLFDLIEKNPLDRVPRPKVPKRKSRPMPHDDVGRILRTAPLRLRPWFYLATYCGLRSCDIAPLRAEHLLWRQGWLLVPETKGGDERAVPVPPVVAEHLEPLPREGWLFPRQDGKQGPVNAHLVSELANRFLRKIGARQTFHGLRHWYGTEALTAAGGNIRVAQEMLGHRNVSSTEIYTQVAAEQMVAAASRLPIVA